MLTEVRRAGYLEGVAGIVAGTFTGCGEPAPIEDILTERLGDLGEPMIAWANVGHGGYFQTFPVGIAAELAAVAATLRLLHPPLQPAISPDPGPATGYPGRRSPPRPPEPP